MGGYKAADPQVAAMINGGGIMSMVRVACIVSLSSAFSGIFRSTGLLDSIKQAIGKLSARTNPFAATMCTSLVAGMIACNQTLAIMLTNQLCDDLEPDNAKRAMNLENTAVVLSALVPWSIASGVPLASVGGPAKSILLACFLYLLPLWRLLVEYSGKKQVK